MSYKPRDGAIIFGDLIGALRYRQEAMMDVSSIIPGIVGGIIAWFGADFLARPIRQFFQLRGEICEAMVMFDNVRAGDLTRLKEAREAFRELGARMLAFAHTEWLGNWLIARWRYDPIKAGRSLIGVSNTIGTPGNELHQHKLNVMAALRITGL